MIRGLPTVRYATVSAICLFLSMALIPLFSVWGLHYTLATAVAFALVAIVGFSLHCRWTFSAEPTPASFFRYVSAMALNLPLTIILIAIGHDIFGLSVTIATAIASMFLFLWNFVAVRWAMIGPTVGVQQ